MLDRLGLILLIGLSVLLLISCGNKESGPAEQVGKEIDKATVSVGKQVEKAGESIQEAGKADAP
jgi:PBP1b-binding outer membrane lipoprotein LpoB